MLYTRTLKLKHIEQSPNALEGDSLIYTRSYIDNGFKITETVLMENGEDQCILKSRKILL